MWALQAGGTKYPEKGRKRTGPASLAFGNAKRSSSRFRAKPTGYTTEANLQVFNPQSGLFCIQVIPTISRTRSWSDFKKLEFASSRLATTFLIDSKDRIGHKIHSLRNFVSLTPFSEKSLCHVLSHYSPANGPTFLLTSSLLLRKKWATMALNSLAGVTTSMWIKQLGARNTAKKNGSYSPTTGSLASLSPITSSAKRFATTSMSATKRSYLPMFGAMANRRVFVGELLEN